jgi:hypothetical protein
MAAPGTSTAVVRKDLAGLQEGIDLEAQRRGFIGLMLMPIFQTPSVAGQYPVLKSEELIRYNTKVGRSPGGGYYRDSFKWDSATYSTQERGAEEPVDDRLENIYRSYFDMEAVATKRAYDRVLRAQEMRIAALIFDATYYTGATYYLDASAAVAWTNPAATILANIDLAKRAIYAKTGMWPDTIAFNYNNLLYIRNNDEILDRISSSGAGSPVKASDVTRGQLANVFDIPNVLVAGGSQNTAQEGRTASLSDVWSSSYVWIGITSNSQDISEPCVGRTWHWDQDGSEPLGHLETYRDETIRGDVVRVRHEVDEQRVKKESGFLIKIA